MMTALILGWVVVVCCLPLLWCWIIYLRSGDKLVVVLVRRWVGAYHPHQTCSSGYNRLPWSPFLCGDGAVPGKELFASYAYQYHFTISCCGGSLPCHDYGADPMEYIGCLRLRNWFNGRGDEFARSEFVASVRLLLSLLWQWIDFVDPTPFFLIRATPFFWCQVMVMPRLRRWFSSGFRSRHGRGADLVADCSSLTFRHFLGPLLW